MGVHKVPALNRRLLETIRDDTSKPDPKGKGVVKGVYHDMHRSKNEVRKVVGRGQDARPSA